MRWQVCGAVAAAVVVSSLVVVGRASSFDSSAGDALSLHVWKTRHQMALLEGDQVLRTFRVALGRDSSSSKIHRGDGRTPEGHYAIIEKRAQSRFHRFLALNYPNLDDAERAFAQRLITVEEWADIFFASVRQERPPWSTPLGGDVGIHGYGERPLIPVDWTEGCIAVSNADIDYLYDRLPVGTPVIITE